MIAVFGGSGFLGRYVVGRLAGAGLRVRVAVRHPQASACSALGPEVEVVRADVRDEVSVAKALAGCEAAINSVGLYVERGDASFDAVHVRGAANVAREAKRAGLARLVHISGIGADPISESSYVRSRAEGEARVREAFEGATILRPSVLFGPGDSFFSTLATIARLSPLLPLFGSGTTMLQPVFVSDVAEAVAKALDDPGAPGQVYELGGPKAYQYRELVRLLLRQLDRKRLLLPVPYFLWELQAAVLSVLPSPPLTRDQVALMKGDNVVSPNAPSFSDLGIAPKSVEELLPTFI